MSEKQQVSTPAGRVTKDFTFDVKSVTDAGTIEGYASVFGVMDSEGDVVAAGAFSRTIKAWAAKGRPVPVLWQHDAFQPIGVTDSIEEDEKGLRVRATLLSADVVKAREAHALAKANALGGLSIGFSVPNLASDGQPATFYDEEQNARVFREVKLWEYSLVTFPANEDAVITSVKTAEAPEWVAELTDAVRELRAVLDQRESVTLLRDIRAMMKQADVPSVGAPRVVDSALSGVLKEARSLLRSSATAERGRS